MKIFLFLVFIVVVCDAILPEFSENKEPRPPCKAQLCSSPKDSEAEKEATGCFGCFPCFGKKKKKDKEKYPDFVPPPHNPADPTCQCEECFLFNEEERNSLRRKVQEGCVAFLEWLGDDGVGDDIASKFLKDCVRFQ